MKILQNVIVNQVLTEIQQESAPRKVQIKTSSTSKRSEQLRFELKKLEKTRNLQPASLRTHFEKEINQRQEKIKLLEFQMEQLEIFPLEAN